MDLKTPPSKKKIIMKRPFEETKSKGNYSFYIYNTQDQHSATFETLRFGKDQDFYVLKFHRPGLQKVHLYTFYILKDDCDCIYSTQISYAKDALDSVTLMDRCYQVYETYTLAQDTEDAGITYALYFSIDHDSSKVRMDMSSSWLGQHVPQFVKNVRFFPYDVDPTLYGLKLDTSKVPQRTPLWFKVRGELTGTKAYHLLGFWVPTIEDDPNWTLDGDHVFDEQSKRNMRFGSESEDKALLVYASNSKHITKIQAVGWCKASPPLPSSWGSSPDGLVTDKDHTWEDVPEDIRKYYDSSSFDPREGVLEIKSSQRKISLDAYFFPQVYMEMISTNRLWCDLVRYTPSTVRVYRIYRHKPTEDMLVSLWKYARSNVDRLRDVIQEEAFVKIRDYFKRLSSVVSFTEFKVNTEVRDKIKSYEEYQRKKEEEGRQKGGDYTFLSKKSKTSHWFEEVDTNHKAFYGVINDKTRLKNLILKQIKIYNEVLKDL